MAVKVVLQHLFFYFTRKKTKWYTIKITLGIVALVSEESVLILNQVSKIIQ